MTSHVQVAVIGAGICGLTCAYALRKTGIDAHLLEASARSGGVIQSVQKGGYLLELGPQSFTLNENLWQLSRDLGIESQRQEANRRLPRYVFADGRLQRVPMSPPAFLTSGFVNARTKWSVLRDFLGRSSPPENDESLANFVRRKFSAELLEKLVGPFVSGIYAGDPEKLSVQSAFPQLREAEKKHGSVIRGMIRASKTQSGAPRALFGYAGGNELLIKALTEKIGNALHLDTPVTSIKKSEDGVLGGFFLTIQPNGISSAELETVRADHVILATPAGAAGILLESISPELTALLAGIEYAPVAVVSLGYRQADVTTSLDGFGFLIPRSAGVRTLGSVWNSSLFPGRAPDGNALVTSFLGGVTDASILSLEPSDLVSLAHKEVAAILGIKSVPEFSHAQIWPRAIPQYNLGHSSRLARIAEILRQIPGLRITGNFLSGPAVGSCIDSALKTAQDTASLPASS